MNKIEIANLFIKAAMVDRRLPDVGRTAKLKAQGLPFVHDRADINGWFSSEKEAWRWDFLDPDKQKLTADDIADWERANDLIRLVADEGNRRALWAWAKSKVGSLTAHVTKTRTSRKGFGKMKSHKRTNRDVSFVAWCRSEGIHEMTGSRRKDRAISVIEQHLVRGTSPNILNDDFGVLPVGPVFEHISDNIAADAATGKRRSNWQDEDTVFTRDAAIFDWRELRNADRRRKAEARRRVAA